MPTDSTGGYRQPIGAPVKPGLARNDPRWIRPLPWTIVVAPKDAREGLLALIGLALVNVAIPLGILRLAARGGRWTIRVLMALPVAAVVPLNVFLAIEPVIPGLPAPFPASARLLFASGTLAGIPVVACPVLIGWSLVHRRWKVLALVLVLTILMSLMIGGVWLWFDMRSMPAIEHYSWTGWYLAAIPGVYAVGVLAMIAWIFRAGFRLLDRRRRTAIVITSADGGR